MSLHTARLTSILQAKFNPFLVVEQLYMAQIYFAPPTPLLNG